MKLAIFAIVFLVIIVGVVVYGVKDQFSLPDISSTNPEVTNLGDLVKSSKEKQEPSKPDIDIRALESEIHQLVNGEREKMDLTQLEYDSKLADIARSHSLDMMQRDYLEHVSPDGQDPTHRAEKFGYLCEKMIDDTAYSGITENLARNTIVANFIYVTDNQGISGQVIDYDWKAQDVIADEIVQGWMDSPLHKKNIEDKIVDREGIGIILTEEYRVIVTQNFC